MNTLKQLLLKISPNVYFYLRDHYQFYKSVFSGKFEKVKFSSQQVRTFKDAYDFTGQFLPSYQIETEIAALIEFIADHKPVNYVEIGTADGGTHFMIRKLCSSIKKSVAIDTDIRNKLIIERITDTAQSHYIRGFSNSPKVLSRFHRLFENNSVDVLFIDGDHSYDGVKSDFENYAPCVKSGGLIIFHDIVQDWGLRHGRETNKYAGGVPQFFREIKGRYTHKTFIENSEQDGFGIGVLIQP